MSERTFYVHVLDMGYVDPYLQASDSGQPDEFYKLVGTAPLDGDFSQETRDMLTYRALRAELPLDLVESLYKWREAMRSTAGEFVQPAPSIVTDAMQRWVRATGEKP